MNTITPLQSEVYVGYFQTIFHFWLSVKNECVLYMELLYDNLEEYSKWKRTEKSNLHAHLNFQIKQELVDMK